LVGPPCTKAQAAGQERLLEGVIAAYDGCQDARLKQIMEAAVRHLHAFVSEVGLTNAEWHAGIRFLTEVGQLCSEWRQEFILLSDTLGVSSLVEMIGFAGSPGATENTVQGPFYVPGSPMRAYGDSIVVHDEGTPLVIRGRVTDLDGLPIPGALLDVWQNSTNGLYAVQDPEHQHPDNLRGKFLAADDGSFEFHTVRPVPYTIPDDGPAGRLIHATGRHPWRAAHIHIIASAPGFKALTTHVFDADSDYLDSDAVFGVRDSLIVRFAPVHPGGDGGLEGRFDIALEPTVA
jgi:protocatechuate 3,4-dioxygenase beta subunit